MLHLRVLVALLGAVLPALAQQASVQGVVTDESGAGVPNASVKITSASTGFSLSVTTNEQGFYSIPFLNPATYRAETGAPGFAQPDKSNQYELLQLSPIKTAHFYNGSYRCLPSFT